MTSPQRITIPGAFFLCLSCLAASDPRKSYSLGYQHFRSGDYPAAARAFAELAPFGQPDIGPHAQYLLARIHHLSGELPEAAAAYAALIESHHRDQSAATESGASPAKSPPHISRALFLWGTLLMERARFADAEEKFADALKHPDDPQLSADARLRLAICRARTRKWKEAIANLEVLRDHPTLRIDALIWLSRSLAASVDPTQLQALGGNRAPLIPDFATRSRALDQAAFHLQSASQLLAAAQNEPRRQQILLELASLLEISSRSADAAKIYDQIPTPTARYRRAVALQLSRDTQASIGAFRQFLRDFPTSEFAPEAEVRILEQGGDIDLFLDLQKRAQEKGDLPRSSAALFNIAQLHYHRAHFTDAAKTLESIPPEHRTPDAAYLLADCLLRQIPPNADVEDALTAARLSRQLESIKSLLGSYIRVTAGLPESVDPLLKLAFCHQRSALLLADDNERRQGLIQARRTYADLATLWPAHPLAPVAALESAKCVAQWGQGPLAGFDLAKFNKEPLLRSPLYPLAMIHLGDSLRLRGQPELAVINLQTTQRDLESKLPPQWLPILRYAIALALKESRRPDEAIARFEAFNKDFPDHPNATNASWRILECRSAAAREKVDAARAEPLRTKTETFRNDLIRALKDLRAIAETSARNIPDSTVALQIHTDTLSSWRTLAQAELLLASPDPDSSAGLDTPITLLPLQPAEIQLRQSYRTLIDSSGDTRLSIEARFDLADLHTRRGQNAEAITLLEAALKDLPTPDISDPLRLRLANAYLQNDNPDAAATHFRPLLDAQRPFFSAHARIGLIEALSARKDWPSVIREAAPLLDQEDRRTPGWEVADQGLLLLARAHSELGQWNDSATTLERMLKRFPGSSLSHEARLDLARAYEKLSRPADAAALYAEVLRRAPDHLRDPARERLKELNPNLVPAHDRPRPNDLRAQRQSQKRDARLTDRLSRLRIPGRNFPRPLPDGVAPAVASPIIVNPDASDQFPLLPILLRKPPPYEPSDSLNDLPLLTKDFVEPMIDLP